MSIFALVVAGLIADIAAAEFPVVPEWTWLDVTNADPTPQVGWSAAQVNGGWTFTAPAAPPGPSLGALARAALADSDTAMHRISEGVVLGKTSWTATDVVAFITWRVLLRAIMNETASPAPSVLPARPAYPAGT